VSEELIKSISKSLTIKKQKWHKENEEKYYYAAKIYGVLHSLVPFDEEVITIDKKQAIQLGFEYSEEYDKVQFILTNKNVNAVNILKNLYYRYTGTLLPNIPLDNLDINQIKRFYENIDIVLKAFDRKLKAEVKKDE
jgi:hypothetical protein